MDQENPFCIKIDDVPNLLCAVGRREREKKIVNFRNNGYGETDVLSILVIVFFLVNIEGNSDCKINK